MSVNYRYWFSNFSINLTDDIGFGFFNFREIGFDIDFSSIAIFNIYRDTYKSICHARIHVVLASNANGSFN